MIINTNDANYDYGVLKTYEPFAYSTSTLPMPIIGSLLPLTDGQLVIVSDTISGFYGKGLKKGIDELTAGIYCINTPVAVTAGDDNKTYYTFEGYTKVGEYVKTLDKTVNILEEEVARLDAESYKRTVEANRKPVVLEYHQYDCGICANKVAVKTYSNGLKSLMIAGTITATLEKNVAAPIAMLIGDDRPIAGFDKVIVYKRGEIVCTGLLAFNASTGAVTLTPYSVSLGGIVDIKEFYV